jgi:acyl dehydratase
VSVERYRVRAHNTATDSTNKIHDDTVARRLGFRGGLVPGVDVFAYLCHLPAREWGRAWLERGTIAARFGSPVYDGDEVEVDATGDGGELRLELRDPAGAVCATADATRPDGATPPPDPADWPRAALPGERPDATPSTLRDATFGCVEATFRADRAGQYLDDVRERLPLFRDRGPAHPGWLLRFANTVLAANVRLGPWIHVASAVRYHGTVEDGDRVETRAVVTDVRERKGHRLVDLSVLQTVAERPVAVTAHTAIYRPRGT